MSSRMRDIKPFGLRLGDEKKDRVRGEAEKNRHSMNVEIDLLIEDGFKWREMQSKQAAA